MFRAAARRFGFMLVLCAAVTSLIATAALVAAMVVYLLSLLVP